MDSVFVYRSSGAAPAGDGPLRGLRVAVQPSISVAGWPAEAGSNALAKFRALEDATVVQRLRQAGAFLCGSTRMSEFGFGLRGSEAGGALRERSADAELMLDHMGESRLAAVRAGVCGFKPSWGLVSRFGLIGLIPSMECCAVLSSSPRQIREVIKTAAGQDGLDFSLPDEKSPDFSPHKIDPKNTTIGVISETLAGLQPEYEKMFRASLDALRSEGFKLREMSFPDFPLFPLVHQIVGSVEASSAAGRYDSVRYGPRAPGAKNWNEMYLLSRGIAFGPLVKSYLFQGAFFQFERYEAFEDACRIRARLLAGMKALTAQADFLVFPAVDGAPCGEPATLADTYAQFDSTLFANVTGQPALCLPPGRSAGHTAIQLAGPRLSDARLLDLGEYLTDTWGGQ
ncbi:MAG: amidase family protein [Dehalococcoidia bacterium]|nr:amidase family protein [Dehalococcoidia bacterium]